MFLLFRDRYLAYRNLVKKNIEIMNVENKLETTKELLEKTQQEEKLKFDDTETDSDIMLKDISAKLEKFMKNEKPYFEKNITIDEICLKLATNRTYLSNAIKQEFGISFSSYVNEFRIKEAMRLLLSPDFENYSIEGIGKQVGFNNRISFNTNFKKFTGVSPSIFRTKN